MRKGNFTDGSHRSETINKTMWKCRFEHSQKETPSKSHRTYVGILIMVNVGNFADKIILYILHGLYGNWCFKKNMFVGFIPMGVLKLNLGLECIPP